MAAFIGEVIIAMPVVIKNNAFTEERLISSALAIKSNVLPIVLFWRACRKGQIYAEEIGKSHVINHDEKDVWTLTGYGPMSPRESKN